MKIKDLQSQSKEYILHKIKTNVWWASFCEFEYDRSGCTGNCDYYCRCSQIINIKIESFNEYDFYLFLIDDKPLSIIDKYCINRIIRAADIKPQDCEITTTSGYYGEEIDELILSQNKIEFLVENIEKLFSLKSDIEKIFHILDLEYGYILDSIKHCTEVNIEELNGDLICNDDYRKKINLNDNFYDERYNLPRGIFLAKHDSKKLIDGYHRILKAKKIELENIPIIIIK